MITREGGRHPRRRWAGEVGVGWMKEGVPGREVGGPFRVGETGTDMDLYRTGRTKLVDLRDGDGVRYCKSSAGSVQHSPLIGIFYLS